MSKQYTRAEVAKIGSGKDMPLLIIRNKVYNVTSWLQDHPGGVEVLVDCAGKDCTKEYEEIGHSEAAIDKRETYLVGEIVKAEQRDYAELNKSKKKKINAGGGVGMPGSGLLLQAAVAAVVALYIKKAMDARAIPSVTYSAALRHAHLAMGVGALGSVTTVSAAMMCEMGQTRKNLMEVHKGLGVLMAAGLIARVWARLKSTIPPRFPGSPALQQTETLSHWAAYELIALLTGSGLTYSYYSGSGAPLPFLGSKAIPGKSAPKDEDYQYATSTANFHKFVGKVFSFGFLPFHLIVTAYHYNNGRDVIKKITPFI